MIDFVTKVRHSVQKWSEVGCLGLSKMLRKSERKTGKTWRVYYIPLRKYWGGRKIFWQISGLHQVISSGKMYFWWNAVDKHGILRYSLGSPCHKQLVFNWLIHLSYNYLNLFAKGLLKHWFIVIKCFSLIYSLIHFFPQFLFR